MEGKSTSSVSTKEAGVGSVNVTFVGSVCQPCPGNQPMAA